MALQMITSQLHLKLELNLNENLENFVKTMVLFFKQLDRSRIQLLHECLRKSFEKSL